MNQDEFQKKVLQLLEGLDKRVQQLEDFTERQEEFNKKLWVAVENDTAEQIGAHSDEMKSYTDQKIERHEKKFRHVVAA